MAACYFRPDPLWRKMVFNMAIRTAPRSMVLCAVAFGVPFGAALGVAFGVSCGGDDESAADRVGVGAACSARERCPQATRNGAQIDLTCIEAFRGGYCGIKNCQADTDCPDGSACVNHDDGSRYCFRVCADKSECNRNRDPENESNCSSNVDFAQVTTGIKACVPPSGN